MWGRDIHAMPLVPMFLHLTKPSERFYFHFFTLYLETTIFSVLMYMCVCLCARARLKDKTTKKYDVIVSSSECLCVGDPGLDTGFSNRVLTSRVDVASTSTPRRFDPRKTD